MTVKGSSGNCEIAEIEDTGRIKWMKQGRECLNKRDEEGRKEAGVIQWT